MVVANSAGSSPGTVNLLQGNGDGTFGAPVEYPAGINPVAVVLADFNNDGWLDVATANNAGHGASVLLNDGTGAFLAPTEYSTLKVGQTASYPESVAAGDFN